MFVCPCSRTLRVRVDAVGAFNQHSPLDILSPVMFQCAALSLRSTGGTRPFDADHKAIYGHESDLFGSDNMIVIVHATQAWCAPFNIWPIEGAREGLFYKRRTTRRVDERISSRCST